MTDEQSGVVHRRQLYELGWTRWQVDAQIDGGRWAQVAGGVIITHRGPLPDRARWWAAVLQVGPRAALAGSTALQAAGLTGVSDDVIHVAAPKSSRPRRPPGVRVHETRLLSHDDVVLTGLPRVRPVAAAVQAALWARTDRQACLYLVSAVQQRLVTAVDLADRLARVTRHRRLPLLRSVASDVVDGAQALSELDFAALCRRRGLPRPTRQSVVTTALGRCFLDVDWEDWGVAAEIDGSHHMQVGTWLDDAWRQNEVVIDGRRVLRFPLLAIRIDPDRAMDQTEAALRRAGWRPPLRRRPTSGRGRGGTQFDAEAGDVADVAARSRTASGAGAVNRIGRPHRPTLRGA